MPSNRTLGWLWLVTMAAMISTFGLTGQRMFLEIALAGGIGFFVGRLPQS
jgi:hypothetical protein